MTTITRKLNYDQLVSELFSPLNDREREVLTKRYSLGGVDKETLEQIGKAYNITRERVRQIENEGLKKVRVAGSESTPAPLKDLESLLAAFIKQYGGFIGQSHLMDNLLHTDESAEVNGLKFLLEQVVSANYNQVKHPEFDIVWISGNLTEDQIIDLASAIVSTIDGHGNPMSFEELLKANEGSASHSTIESLDAENHFIYEALLRARKDLKKNILDQWGKDSWTTITPKRMTDKAYLIMLREQRPLHFEECAELINGANFDKKKACAATVHNELILDDKYVLVGRGMYALKDWGYESGTVSDIIEKVLEAKGALNKKDLTDEVLKQRIVQKTTITLALMNKDRFAKADDGTYKVA